MLCGTSVISYTSRLSSQVWKRNWTPIFGRFYSSADATRTPELRELTPADDEFIVQQRAENISVARIAEQLGVPFLKVHSRIYRHLKPQGRISSKPPSLFSPEEDTLLLRLKQEGLSFSRIASRMPRHSYQSVCTRYRRLKRNGTDGSDAWILRGSYTPNEISDLRHLREEERLPWREIAKRMGRTLDSVQKKYFSIAPPSKPENVLPQPTAYAETDISAITEMRDNGSSWGEISKALGKRTADSMRQAYNMRRYGRGDTEYSYQRFSEAEDQKLKELRAAGLNWYDMSEQFHGRSYRSLMDRWRRLHEPND